MHDALSLLSDLPDADIAWLLEIGETRLVPAGATIIAEGSTPADLFFVLHGLVAIRIAGMGAAPVATLGPGELLGEISFLEERPASATVQAVESGSVLAIPRDALARRLKGDPAFSARLYRAFARIVARRLRERVPAVGRDVKTAAVAHEGRLQLSQALEQFKTAVQEADRGAMANQQQIPASLSAAVEEAFRAVTKVAADLLGNAHEVDSDTAGALSADLHREMLPYVLLSHVAERAYSKPRGYAGDYLTIEWIYGREATGTGRVGPIIDRCYLELSAAQAVRNRRALLAREIHQTLGASEDAEVRVTSLASGPARELFDVFGQLDPPIRLKASLIDIDPEALEFVRREAGNRNLSQLMDLHLANLVHLATGRQRLDLPPQHLVYSIGLIDYFDDRFVVNLLNYGHGLLQAGGRIILGNFHRRNPDKALLEHTLGWKLIHRTEDDVNRLFAASRFSRPCTRVLFEDEGINLFAECTKD